MRWVFIILVFVLIFCWAASAYARNDYLGSSNSSCERGRVELYTELREQMVKIYIKMVMVILTTATHPMMMTLTEPLDYVLVGLCNQRVTMRP